MEFNEKLQELRKGRGLTQEELAERLFVSRTAVSKWESGRGYPSIDSLRELSRFFSVTIDELICPEEILSAAQEEKQTFADKMLSFLCNAMDLLTATLKGPRRSSDTSRLSLAPKGPHPKYTLFLLT